MLIALLLCGLVAWFGRPWGTVYVAVGAVVCWIDWHLHWRRMFAMAEPILREHLASVVPEAATPEQREGVQRLVMEYWISNMKASQVAMVLTWFMSVLRIGGVLLSSDRGEAFRAAALPRNLHVLLTDPDLPRYIELNRDRLPAGARAPDFGDPWAP